jgi:hypothetical protein
LFASGLPARILRPAAAASRGVALVELFRDVNLRRQTKEERCGGAALKATLRWTNAIAYMINNAKERVNIRRASGLASSH